MHQYLTKSSIWFISVLFADECCSSNAASSWLRLCININTSKLSHCSKYKMLALSSVNKQLVTNINWIIMQA